MAWNGLITKLRNDDDYTQSYGRVIHVAPRDWTVTGTVPAGKLDGPRRVCCDDAGYHSCTTEPPCTGDPTVRQLAPGPVSLALHPNARIDDTKLHVGVHVAAVIDLAKLEEPEDLEKAVGKWHADHFPGIRAVYHLYVLDKDQPHLPPALQGLRGKLLAVAVAPCPV